MFDLDIVPAATRGRGIKLVAAAAVIYAGLHFAGFHKFFANDAEGLGGLLQIIGTLYSVVYAFATYVVWGQYASVENEIVEEAGALKSLVLVSRRLKDTTRDPIVRAIKAYARGVVESEWGLLSHGENTDRTDKLFSSVITSVIEARPADESEQRACELLLTMANEASAHRDERLAISAKRMPQTLLLFVKLTAFMILLLFFFYPFRNLALGVISIAIVALLLFFANFVLTDLDNPFEGAWNVDAHPFSELAATAR